LRFGAGADETNFAYTANRPMGVMFLAGPTGTGKTELAKKNYSFNIWR